MKPTPASCRARSTFALDSAPKSCSGRCSEVITVRTLGSLVFAVISAASERGSSQPVVVGATNATLLTSPRRMPTRISSSERVPSASPSPITPAKAEII
jgi:hypothetical protein